MIRVTAVSHYLHPVREGEALPSLDAALRDLCREPFRRIDRFIQLALLGSAIPIVVAASRVYRGMHYLTDVLAGALASAIWITVVLVVLQDGGHRLKRAGRRNET